MVEKPRSLTRSSSSASGKFTTAMPTSTSVTRQNARGSGLRGTGAASAAGAVGPGSSGVRRLSTTRKVSSTDSDRGDDRPPQHRADVAVEQGEADQRDERADDGAEGVAGAVEAEGATEVLARHRGGDEGVARCRAHALAEPVDDAPDEHHGPDVRRRHEHLAERGEAVPGGDERPPAAAVGPASGDVLRDARRRPRPRPRRRRAPRAGRRGSRSRAAAAAGRAARWRRPG